jgi:hypothetical protein
VQPFLLWKAVRFTSPESMSVALDIQHAMRMLPIVIWGLPGSTTFFHILLKGTIFGIKLLKQNVCFGFLYNFCPKHFSF